MAAGGIHLIRALNEIAAIVQKAGLGAGLPPGQAEDLGRLAAYLAGTGGDMRAISDALVETPARLDVRWEDDRIVVHDGSAAMVAPAIRDAFVMGIRHARLAHDRHGDLAKTVLAMAGYDVEVAGSALDFRAAQPPATPVGPVDIADNIWTQWAALAAKTYVPASDRSRRAGAGAGLTDND